MQTPTASYPTVALTLPISGHPHAVLQPWTADGIPPTVNQRGDCFLFGPNGTFIFRNVRLKE